MSKINEFMTGEVTAKALSMIRTSLSIPRPIVLLEGENDRRVFRTLLRDHAEVFPGRGKQISLDVLNYLTGTDPQNWLVIIVDADFDRILGISHDAVVMLTDCHDLDSEHIKSIALDKVVYETCSNSKIEREFKVNLEKEENAAVKAIRDKLISLAYPIGLLRLISIQKQLSLAFKFLDCAKIIKNNKMELDVVSLIRSVLAVGAKPGTTVDNVMADLEAASVEDYDPWQICQGHDLCKLLVLAIKRHWGIGKLSENEIERYLRLAYEGQFFWQTNLGKDLLARFEIMKKDKPDVIKS